MLSLIPLLIHDSDLPTQVRAALQEASIAHSPAARAKAHRVAAAGLQAAYGLACSDVKDLFGPHAEDVRCAA